MNNNKRTNLKRKFRYTISKLTWVILFTIGMNTLGCMKETTNGNEYFIKYEVSSSTTNSGGKLNVVFNDANGRSKSNVIGTLTSWEVVLGPVKKGFNATISTTKEGSPDDELKLNAQIFVSKNGNEFELKKADKSDVPRSSLQVSYTIDY
ncbi:hypothetical protein [Polluticaenibacter yanchengensis]|uniref:Uncharacterized protein n=1 Tax=Polluticaenibacter yanchengensis TaxID=3014562 RepID=A0ABT4UHY6_9BACT|nr:hypothetical protein [Chitinophagaceae bacterium LY-5]